MRYDEMVVISIEKYNIQYTTKLTCYSIHENIDQQSLTTQRRRVCVALGVHLMFVGFLYHFLIAAHYLILVDSMDRYLRM